MKKLLILILFVPIMSFAQVREDGGFRALLKGTVTGADGRKLYIKNAFERNNTVDDRFIIPLVDGKFEFLFEGDHVKRYDLVFVDDFLTGRYSFIPFYPDAELLEFTLRGGTNTLKGEVVSSGNLNCAEGVFREELARVFKEKDDALRAEEAHLENIDRYFSQETSKIRKQVESTNDSSIILPLFDKLDEMKKDGTFWTPEGKELSEKIDALHKEILKWQYEYMATHPDIFSYSMLIEELYYDREIKPEISDMERAYAALSAANPGHPYNKTAGDGIYALNNIVAGKMFIDFTAPTLDGEMHTLSEEIKGKVAVIDLWASWCGSCRKNSMNMIPLYEKYKDRGFTVVGVAREFKNTDNLVIALRRDGYPWLNLVELDDRAEIWMKYGANNAGGRVILVDEQGKIVRLDATAEEIGEYLSSRFD